MPTKLEYLKRAINSPVIENKTWFILCFSIPILKEEANWQDRNLLDVVTKQDGLYFIDSNEAGEKELVKISDYKKDTPLFAFQDLVEVDPSWGSFIKSKMETKIGVLIINALIIYPSFRGKLEYINESIKISKLEKVFAERVVNDDLAKPTDITVSEMIDCLERFSFLSNLANIITVATTHKAITPPTNIDKIRKDLFKEYEGQLSDPVKLVELEDKLDAIDKEYLKDDVAANIITNGKAKTARKKMFLIYGDPLDFKKSTKANTITTPLVEGLNTDEEDFPKYMNDQRFGSFARGGSTQLGGYTYKILQRSLSSLEIASVECNTKRGLKRLITDSNVSKIVNRYIKDGNKWILIEDLNSANKYLNKEIEIRSSLYCTSPKNTICYKCMNEIYKTIPTGVTNIASEISSILMNIFMQLTHVTKTESVAITLEDLAA